MTASRDEAVLQSNFLASIRGGLNELIGRHRHRVPALEHFGPEYISTFTDPAALMHSLLGTLSATQEKLYVLIDEYDTFTNALLSADQRDLYDKITDKFGFVRAFYRVLKAGADSGAVGRVFITGGTPILIDDLMTGFNIVTNISNKPRFNALAGFTRTDVERAVDEVLGEMPDLSAKIGDRSALLETLERFYDGYRFAEKSRERMFNSTLVVYCLRELVDSGEYPQNMLDPNARTDYQKLHALWASAGPAAEERREVLERILAEGQVTSPLVDRFGVRTTTTTGQFVSLMYYTGMITLAPEEPNGDFYTFVPPNRVIRELSWEHYTRLLEDLHRIPLIGQPMGLAFLAMAIDGNMQPFLDQLRKNILPVLSVRDLRKHDEKAMKMLLIGTLVTSNLFYVLSEKEFAQGFNDLFITPMRSIHKAKYAWMFELKYVVTDADDADEECRHRTSRGAIAAVFIGPAFGADVDARAGAQGSDVAVRRRKRRGVSGVYAGDLSGDVHSRDSTPSRMITVISGCCALRCVGRTYSAYDVRFRRPALASQRSRRLMNTLVERAADPLAWLLNHVFAIEVNVCPKCAGGQNRARLVPMRMPASDLLFLR